MRRARAALALALTLLALVALPALHAGVHVMERAERVAALRRVAIDPARPPHGAGRHFGHTHARGRLPKHHQHGHEHPHDQGPARAPHDHGTPGGPLEHGKGALEHLGVALHTAFALPVLPAPRATEPPAPPPWSIGVLPRIFVRPCVTRGPPVLCS